MTFENVIQQLKEKKLEDIIREKGLLVECFRNEVYFDDDLENFMDDLNAEIFKFKDYFAYIKSRVSGKEYKIPYIEKANRFDLDLPFEIILDFSQIIPIELNTLDDFNKGFKIVRDGKIITLTPKEMSDFRFLDKALDGYNCLEVYRDSGIYSKEEVEVIEKLMKDKYSCHAIEENILDSVFTDNAEVERDVIDYYIEQEKSKKEKS